MVNKIQTRDINHSKTTAWEIDCNSLTLEEALKILNPNNYSIYRMAEKRGAYKRVVMELDNARHKIKVLEIIKEHIKFEDSGIETYTDYLKNLVTKFMIRLESKDTGATFHIHLDTKEEFDLLKEVLE